MAVASDIYPVIPLSETRRWFRGSPIRNGDSSIRQGAFGRGRLSSNLGHAFYRRRKAQVVSVHALQCLRYW